MNYRKVTFATLLTLCCALQCAAQTLPAPLPLVVPCGVTEAVLVDDGNDAGGGGGSYRLGGMGLLADGEWCGIELTVTGRVQVAFAWKASSEYGYDVLRFYEVGGDTTNELSGTGTNWEEIVIPAASAADTVRIFRWEYEKDPYGDYVGQDCGWIEPRMEYRLNVVNGIGSGWYPVSSAVTISALAIDGAIFDHWETGEAFVDTPAAAVATVYTKSRELTVTAVYGFMLNVSNGTGSGAYFSGGWHPITAAVRDGLRFSHWVGDVDRIQNAYAAETVIHIDSRPLSVAAVYEAFLTVINGSGSGWHTEATPVTVRADEPPPFMEFDGWQGTSAPLLDNTASREATLLMPSGPAMLEAIHRLSIARVTGSWGRSYTFDENGVAAAFSADVTASSPSGTPALKLGGPDVIPDGSFAAFETTVAGSGSILFNWRVSSESGGDYLRFLINGTPTNEISGTKGPWQSVSNRIDGLPYKTHALRWEYAKDASDASSQDCGWIDDITWMADAPGALISPLITFASPLADAFTLNFLGERGVPYTVMTNTNLSSADWLPSRSVPEPVGETNGAVLYTATLPKGASKQGFYRVNAPADISPYMYVIVDLSGGTNAASYPVHCIESEPSGGWTEEHKTTKLVLRRIPAGTFTMGSPVNEVGRDITEPEHSVTLTEDFYIGVFEVTQRQWELVMGSRPSHYYNSICYTSRPVEKVSYNDIRGMSAGTGWPQAPSVDAYSFLGRLQMKTGYEFDLPTEAQWEYACRAGTTSSYNNGLDCTGVALDINLAQVARYYGNGGHGYTSSCTTESGTAEVGSYQPNDWGLYDMHGNVSEWCLDWYTAYLESSAAINPAGAVSGSLRVVRGGGFIMMKINENLSYLYRSASRDYAIPSTRSYNVGFRIALPVQ